MRRDRILVLTDLFLGAAYADEEFTADEAREVRRLLAGLLDVDPANLPGPVEERLRTFDPVTFDLEATAREFDQDPPGARARLLGLVGGLLGADGAVEVEEDAYLRRLAAHLEVEPPPDASFAYAYDSEDLRELFTQLRAAPPPMVGEDGAPQRPPPPPLVEDPPEER